MLVCHIIVLTEPTVLSPGWRMSADLEPATVIAGFFTGGALAVRGGMKAARNSAIACACLLAVIEGVGIGFQRMMAENTRLDVGILYREAVHRLLIHFFRTGPTASTTTGICGKLSDTFTCIRTSCGAFFTISS